MGAIGDAVRSCERHADDPGRAASGGRNHAHLRRLLGAGEWTASRTQRRPPRRPARRIRLDTDELLRATLCARGGVGNGVRNDDRDSGSTDRGSVVGLTCWMAMRARPRSGCTCLSFCSAPHRRRGAASAEGHSASVATGGSGDGCSRSDGERARGVVPELSALWPEPQTEGQLVDDRAVAAMHGACEDPDHAALLSTAHNRTLRRGLRAECAEPGDRPGITGCSGPLGYPTEPGQRRARVSTEGRPIDSCDVGGGDASQRNARRRR